MNSITAQVFTTGRCPVGVHRQILARSYPGLQVLSTRSASVCTSHCAGWLCVLFLDFALPFLPLATFTARFPLRFLLFCLEFKIQKFIAFVSAAGTATTATTESVLAFSIGSSRKPGIGIA